jgi:hypothetical protein
MNYKTNNKGDYGEILVHKFLEQKGWVIYKPITNAAHSFDRLAIKNKEKLIIAEVKSKATRIHYPDTGLDIKHYNIYKKIQEKHNLDVYFFFVDEEKKEIYGGWLTELVKECNIIHKNKMLTYPLKQNGIIYFPIDKMKKQCDISDEDVEILKSFTTKHERYKQEQDKVKQVEIEW